MNWNEQIELLRVPLPEDVLKHKWHGDFAAAGRVIDYRLAGDKISDVMKRRLLLEKKILKRLPVDYPYTGEEACRVLGEAIENFRPEELRELMDSDYADWIYINGEPHFRDDIVDNILKTRPDYAGREKNRQPEQEKKDKVLLQEAVETMRRDGSMDRTIRLRARLWLREDAGVQPGETVRAYLPLPATDAQVSAVRVIDDGTANLPKEQVHFVQIAPETAPQRTICWEVSWLPGMEFAVEYEYDIRARYVDLWNEGTESEVPQNKRAQAEGQSAAKTEAAGWLMDPATETDLCEQEPHIVFSPLIRALTAEVVGEETRPLEKARLIYRYITEKLHYFFVRPYVTLPCIPDYLAAGQKGDCGVQALLFITMCRCAGVPARWQSGLYANPAYVGNHDWARFYTEEYGWLFADCSFGGSAYRAGNEMRHQFYFGNLEPFRMPSCRLFQADFEPSMKGLRNDPYDAQSGEVEFEREELHDCHPFESETVMVDYRKLSM